LASAQSKPSALETVVTDGLLEIRRGPENETCLIRLIGELDLANAGSVEKELRLAEAQRPATIVLDLSRLDFIDSSGIALLIHAARRSQANGHKLGLIPGPRAVRHTLEICGVDGLLPLLDREAL
jgi:anti-anti-sigma factor